MSGKRSTKKVRTRHTRSERKQRLANSEFLEIETRTRSKRAKASAAVAGEQSKKSHEAYKAIKNAPVGEYKHDPLAIHLWEKHYGEFNDINGFYRLIDKLIKNETIKGCNRKEFEVRIPKLLQAKLIKPPKKKGKGVDVERLIASANFRLTPQQKQTMRTSTLIDMHINELRPHLTNLAKNRSAENFDELVEAILVFRVRTKASGAEVKIEFGL